MVWFLKDTAVYTITLMLAGSEFSGGAPGCLPDHDRSANVRFDTRPEVERHTDHADPVIRRALLLVGQPLHPIRVVWPTEIRLMYAHGGAGTPRRGLEAFRAPGAAHDPHIYVNADGTVYRNASRKPSPLTLLMLAATLVHEQVHNTDREFAAYRLQADFVWHRLSDVPRRERDAARRYHELIAMRARALAMAEGLRRRTDATTAWCRR